jgi:hypothetical protein
MISLIAPAVIFIAFGQVEGAGLLTHQERVALEYDRASYLSKYSEFLNNGKKKTLSELEKVGKFLKTMEDESDTTRKMCDFPKWMNLTVAKTTNEGLIILSGGGFTGDRRGFVFKHYVIVNFVGLKVGIPDGESIDGVFVPTGKLTKMPIYGTMQALEYVTEDDPNWKAAREEATKAFQRDKKAENDKRMKFEEELHQSNLRQEAAAKKIREDKSKAETASKAKGEITKLAELMDKSCSNLASAAVGQETFSINAINRHIVNLEKAKVSITKAGLSDQDLKEFTAKADAAIAKGKKAIGGK